MRTRRQSSYIWKFLYIAYLEDNLDTEILPDFVNFLKKENDLIYQAGQQRYDLYVERLMKIGYNEDSAKDVMCYLKDRITFFRFPLDNEVLRQVIDEKSRCIDRQGLQ